MKVVPFYYDDYDDLFANTYVLIDDDKSCVVIDPSKDYDGIINYIEKNELVIKAVLLTHAHFDHIRGVDRLINKYHIPLYIGFDEVDSLYNPLFNCSSLMSNKYVLKSKAITVSDNEVLKLLDEDIICISTPYHTLGSICYYLKDSELLFTGDFLFKGSIGRSDLPTSSPKYFNSSKNKIINLNDNIKIYPGHGPSSSIKKEKETNPYLR